MVEDVCAGDGRGLPVEARFAKLVSGLIVRTRRRDAEQRRTAALETMVAEGRFREDLLYRLNVLEVQVPALRGRREDIPLLAGHFAQEARRLLEDPRQGHAVDDETLAELLGRDWPAATGRGTYAS